MFWQFHPDKSRTGMCMVLPFPSNETLAEIVWITLILTDYN